LWGFIAKTDVLVSQKTNNIFNNINLNTFCDSVSQILKGAVEKYWEQDIQVKTLAFNDFKEIRQEALISNIDFFSSLIKVERHRPVVVRLGKTCISNFLDISFNSLQENFHLTSLTSLEIKILNNFC